MQKLPRACGKCRLPPTWPPQAHSPPEIEKYHRQHRSIKLCDGTSHGVSREVAEDSQLLVKWFWKSIGASEHTESASASQPPPCAVFVGHVAPRSPLCHRCSTSSRHLLPSLVPAPSATASPCATAMAQLSSGSTAAGMATGMALHWRSSSP